MFRRTGLLVNRRLKSGVLDHLPGGVGKADQLATIDGWGARLSFCDTRERMHG